MKKTIGYILPDGTIKNLLEEGFRTHWHYEQWLINSGKSELKKHFSAHQITNLYGWIRINDGTNVSVEHIVELPINDITPEQYESLLNFLDMMMYSNKEFVIVGIEENSKGYQFTHNATWFKRYEFSEYLPDDIIKEIKIEYNKIKRDRGV